MKRWLGDPAFYAQMSRLLEDLIQQRRDSAEAYEVFLRRTEELVQQMAKKHTAGDHPAVLHGRPEATVIFNNLAGLGGEEFKCPEEYPAGLLPHGPGDLTASLWLP